VEDYFAREKFKLYPNIYAKIARMIKISKATRKDINNFSEKEWERIDKLHYGRVVEWKEQNFKFKATEDGKVVGLISGKLEAGVVYIGMIVTLECAMGKGVGRMLVGKTEQFGKRHGAHKMWLITGKDWSENVFYKKLGFKIEGDLPNHHYHTDFVIYTKPIK
jgi:GNAT superfamily N-acetyltransferase